MDETTKTVVLIASLAVAAVIVAFPIWWFCFVVSWMHRTAKALEAISGEIYRLRMSQENRDEDWQAKKEQKRK
ncbi:hypothetical protein [Calycomorphotria hydatis]|uniref:Uncharacterized protein n=1 Tax=Calycomorphotria hydatis TaxID=2528027 RepID=A0A517TBQ6_9PLAN|nr:hypothetical protein [Calycomorphotria hydatis]QDT65806.1 hypothetical protein V22_30680 [Calycomorphotria hydatis]